MPRPNSTQLKKINEKAQRELKPEQVYVFTSSSADTLPIRRSNWFGEYSINMTPNLLNSLKKDYKTGVGLLASHNSNRLPFGRTFDADVRVDMVGNEEVKTLYIDHYVVTHIEDEDGNKRELKTEIGGMTTQDIVNHIEAGHTFDTSIGFAMTDIQCSICKNDLRDHQLCRHYPGMKYEVQNGDTTEMVTCNIIANDGEGIENSLVYAGAVNRATIQRTGLSKDATADNKTVHTDVNFSESGLYNVDDIKNLPKDATLMCFMSKGSSGGVQLYTNTTERQNFEQFIKDKERDEMSANQDNKTTELAAATTLSVGAMVDKELYDEVKASRDNTKLELDAANGQLQDALAKNLELEDKLKKADEKIQELSTKAQLADEFTNDLIEATLDAGVAARGNAFNRERFAKYLATLSVAEIKEEFAALKGEFPGQVEAARVTQDTEELESNDDSKQTLMGLSKAEIRQEAAKRALEKYNKEGGNLAELTQSIYNELLESSK